MEETQAKKKSQGDPDIILFNDEIIHKGLQKAWKELILKIEVLCPDLRTYSLITSLITFMFWQAEVAISKFKLLHKALLKHMTRHSQQL